jgi:hypothetical protein
MEHRDVVEWTRAAFEGDMAEPPPLTLRGANAVDAYGVPEPYDAEMDAPTDAYLEAYSFWAMPYLDARSWRHYLPRLAEYALRHPEDRAMVAESLVRSLRPPDRIPARLTTLSPEQERVIVALLELLALGRADGALSADAAAALDEWWLPDARLRRVQHAPPDGAPAWREVGAGEYRLALPTTLIGGGVQRAGDEEREMELWRGVLCGDALADVFVNVWPLARRGWRETEREIARWLEPERRTDVRVPGAKKALRLDGSTFRYSPAEPERAIVVLALARDRIVTLTVHATDRPDVQREMERVTESFSLHGGRGLTGP